MEFDLEQYNCPLCGWDEAEFDGTYYRLNDNGEQEFNLSHDDIIETELPVPLEYYPKIEHVSGHNHHIINKYYIAPEATYRWTETWLCPHCNKEFTFENEN